MSGATTDPRTRLLARLDVLPDKPEETAESTFAALWFAAAGQPLSATRAVSCMRPCLDPAQSAKLDELIALRLSGVPLAHLTGRQHFAGLEMLAGAAALVPRRETELLAQAAVEVAHARAADHDKGPLIIVDACTGSGNVALVLADRVANARIAASDLSADAVELAQRNAAWLGLAGRVDFRVGDLLAPFDNADFLGRVDVLTCNPPYISSTKVDSMDAEISDHEPRLAFDGGPLGVSILLRLLQETPRFLRPGGWLLFEVGLGQGGAIARRLRAGGAWDEVRELSDGKGAVRAIMARA